MSVEISPHHVRHFTYCKKCIIFKVKSTHFDIKIQRSWHQVTNTSTSTVHVQIIIFRSWSIQAWNGLFSWSWTCLLIHFFRRNSRISLRLKLCARISAVMNIFIISVYYYYCFYFYYFSRNHFSIYTIALFPNHIKTQSTTPCAFSASKTLFQMVFGN